MAKAYFIPNGPKNLADIFPGVDFTQVREYTVEVVGAGSTIATSSVNKLYGECCTDKVRIHFLNYLGGIDAINFCLLPQEHETKSDSYITPLRYPLEKTQHGGNRFNVRANDILTLTNNDYTEAEKDWIDELFDSPKSWMEWTGTQGQPDSYIPVVIQDGKFEKVKSEDRFLYEIKIQVKLSNERIILRN